MDPFIVQKRVPVKRLIARAWAWRHSMPRRRIRMRDCGPKRVLLPLRQHVGKPAEATVKPGERVRRGDVVGEIPEKALGARIHASIDGVVTAVDARGVEITGW